MTYLYLKITTIHFHDLLMGKYDDIINLPHHTSSKHPRMPICNRAAQFAPFAALSGHNDALREMARCTDDKIELSDEEITNISTDIKRAFDNPSLDISISYFVKDKFKPGGKYITHIVRIRKIDEYSSSLLLHDGTIIPLNDILAVTLRH